MDLLRDQVTSFALELDACSSGLLNDYPGQCYPADVMAAILCVQRAGPVLGTNYSSFVSRALRGFIGTKASRHQLPPYLAAADSGRPLSDARGCANSYLCQLAPELWPEQARQWFALNDRFYWQERITAVGYREFASDVPRSNWLMDVDSGPVVAGHGGFGQRLWHRGRPEKRPIRSGLPTDGGTAGDGLGNCLTAYWRFPGPFPI